jgi:hypothetical protein
VPPDWLIPSIASDNAGASAPAPALFKHFGFTKDQIAAKARTTIEYYAANGGAPSLFHKPQF